MGLRKLTQWEETVAKQEQKQSRLMSVAIVCVIAMCAVLWLVQDKLYGDVVQTGTATYLGAFTGAGIGRALRSIKEKESAEKQKRNGKILVWILFLLVIGGAIFLKEFRCNCFSQGFLSSGFSEYRKRTAMRIVWKTARLS